MGLIKFVKSVAAGKLKPYLLSYYQKYYGGVYSCFVNNSMGGPSGPPERFFETSDNRRIPVYPHYRYSIKPGWLYFRPLHLLSRLCQENLVSDRERQFLNQCIGNRTLTLPLEEVEAFLRPIIDKLESVFIPESRLSGDIPVLKPTHRQISQVIDANVKDNSNILKSLADTGLFEAKPGVEILEIGFSSGGQSIFAFERLGFKVAGIDNNYGGLAQANPLTNYLARQLNSKARFVSGNISRETEFEDESFDIIYSVSVLEHVLDLPGAYKEMHRILKPDGVIVHDYGSVFSISGGHALGIPDSPWAHVRLSRTDYFRYLEELRPFEADEAKEWWLKGLSPCFISKMQKYIISAGFNIKMWNGGLGRCPLLGLTPEILEECFHEQPGITLEDLAFGNIFFVADKKR